MSLVALQISDPWNPWWNWWGLGCGTLMDIARTLLLGFPQNPAKYFFRSRQGVWYALWNLSFAVDVSNRTPPGKRLASVNSRLHRRIERKHGETRETHIDSPVETYLCLPTDRLVEGVWGCQHLDGEQLAGQSDLIHSVTISICLPIAMIASIIMIIIVVHQYSTVPDPRIFHYKNDTH